MTKRIENSSPQPCNKYGNWGLGKTFWETIFVCYTRPVSNRFPDCDGFIKKPLFCTGPTVVTFCCMEYWGVAALILPVGLAKGGPGCFVPSVWVHKVPCEGIG